MRIRLHDLSDDEQEEITEDEERRWLIDRYRQREGRRGTDEHLRLIGLLPPED